MLFQEAVVALREGKHLAREAWKNESGEYDKYVVLMRGMLIPWQIIIKPGPNAGNWPALFEDYEASDWMVL